MVLVFAEVCGLVVHHIVPFERRKDKVLSLHRSSRVLLMFSGLFCAGTICHFDKWIFRISITLGHLSTQSYHFGGKIDTLVPNRLLCFLPCCLVLPCVFACLVPLFVALRCGGSDLVER